MRPQVAKKVRGKAEVEKVRCSLVKKSWILCSLGSCFCGFLGVNSCFGLNENGKPAVKITDNVRAILLAAARNATKGKNASVDVNVGEINAVGLQSGESRSGLRTSAFSSVQENSPEHEDVVSSADHVNSFQAGAAELGAAPPPNGKQAGKGSNAVGAGATSSGVVWRCVNKAGPCSVSSITGNDSYRYSVMDLALKLQRTQEGFTVAKEELAGTKEKLIGVKEKLAETQKELAEAKEELDEAKQTIVQLQKRFDNVKGSANSLYVFQRDRGVYSEEENKFFESMEVPVSAGLSDFNFRKSVTDVLKELSNMFRSLRQRSVQMNNVRTLRCTLEKLRDGMGEVAKQTCDGDIDSINVIVDAIEKLEAAECAKIERKREFQSDDVDDKVSEEKEAPKKKTSKKTGSARNTRKK